MKFGDYPKIASLGDVGGFRTYLASLDLDMPCDDAVESGPDAPLSKPLDVLGRRLANRFAIQPMEGWDGTEDGRPSDATFRRWRHFGQSGAKLLWGGEAVAVRHDGRANPNQLLLTPETQADIARLREAALDAHREAFGADDLVIGLQLTHSGRFAKPNDKKRMEPMILYRHPLLDRKFGLGDAYPVMSDDDVARLVDEFVAAAKMAQAMGFDFVDLKHCHGYLGHEFLGAVTRPGRYGGSLENRTRFLREIVEGIRTEAPGLEMGVRLSAIDLVPFRPDPETTIPGRLGHGVPEDTAGCLPYRFGFGMDRNDPTRIDLAETFALFEILQGLGIRFVNVTAGSPYYNPHVTRPALYPPSDGYPPAEEPLVGVMRQLQVTRRLKERFPDFCLMGSGYTYLQEFLPNVAQAVVRQGWVDLVGIGRLVLAYPDLPRDVLEGRPFKTKRLCRTFSDCTTAPRNGLVSGCYPLDAFYKQSDAFKQLAAVKKAAKSA